jgi:polyhydroxybutyrate depolymerase
MYRTYLFLSLVAVAACGGGGSDPATPDAADVDATAPDADLSPPTVFGGDRPATLEVPSSYDPATPTPLVLVLHGYYTDPDYIEPYLKMTTFAEDRGVLVIAPDGRLNPGGNYFWNASDACCDLYDEGGDDVAYLTGLVEDIRAAYNVDPDRIFAIGHSNGGFMALRLACEHPEIFAAVISQAGAAPDGCAPSVPVSVLQVHGDMDPTIQYAGGMLTQNNGAQVAYGSAATTVSTCAAANGCDATTADLPPVDLLGTDGAETASAHHTGCPAGIDAELWTAPDSGHVLLFSNVTVPTVWWTWLSAHPRP